MPAAIRGVLGQSAPVASVLTVLYTCPPLRNALGRVIVTNRSLADANFRVSVAIDAAIDASEQYIAYDKVVLANDTGSTIAFWVGNDDLIRILASTASLSFTFTGIEQDD